MVPARIVTGREFQGRWGHSKRRGVLGDWGRESVVVGESELGMGLEMKGGEYETEGRGRREECIGMQIYKGGRFWTCKWRFALRAKKEATLLGTPHWGTTRVYPLHERTVTATAPHIHDGGYGQTELFNVGDLNELPNQLGKDVDAGRHICVQGEPGWGE
ncbi:hypothetical protein PLEOSDRAFT_164083 [Pleurotus ostreatus PC15]|uniref:Uncharacterized protein n=1 Tax=Pleurotus ostreatus (strain PC15) TaxID=1137138 RepID=A0A067PDK9_PLEO1|nr:hypothetical protein PLEOSDRAFT_164083 [Pleurotus ostreatus PC15]